MMLHGIVGVAATLFFVIPCVIYARGTEDIMRSAGLLTDEDRRPRREWRLAPTWRRRVVRRWRRHRFPAPPVDTRICVVSDNGHRVFAWVRDPPAGVDRPDWADIWVVWDDPQRAPGWERSGQQVRSFQTVGPGAPRFTRAFPPQVAPSHLAGPRRRSSGRLLARGTQP